MEHVLAGDAASPEDAAIRFDGMSPGARLMELANLVAEIAERAATGWRLYRDAAAIDPEIADDWNDLQLLRHQLFTRVKGGIPSAALVEGLTFERAVGSAWAVASPETYDLLVRRLNFTVDDFRASMEQTLTTARLNPHAAPPKPAG